MDWVEWIDSDAWRASLDTVPMAPAVAREVLDMATNPDVSPRQLTSVVSKDPVLATRVSQLCGLADGRRADVWKGGPPRADQLARQFTA